MELIPIIKASLGIFAALLSVTFIISFLVYKIKSRNRLKPYEREPKIFDSSFILEVHETRERKTNKKNFNNKFRVLNEIADIKQNDKKENNPESYAAQKPVAKGKIEKYAKPIMSIHSSNQVFNIYNFYSNSDIIPMHKLKIKTIVTE
jgi:hypothetical protein